MRGRVLSDTSYKEGVGVKPTGHTATTRRARRAVQFISQKLPFSQFAKKIREILSRPSYEARAIFTNGGGRRGAASPHPSSSSLSLSLSLSSQMPPIMRMLEYCMARLPGCGTSEKVEKAGVVPLPENRIKAPLLPT